MAVLYACVYKCSIKMCDFSYYDEGKEKETNFYIFIGGDGKFILIFSPFLIRRTDCLTCKIADMIAYCVIALLRYLNVVTPQLAKSDNVIS